MSKAALVESVEFIFENCESISFDKKYIGYMNLENISRSIQRVAINAIASFPVVGDLAIEILGEGDESYAYYDTKPMKKFDRILEYNDITCVIIHYADGSEEELLVDYNEGDEEGRLGAQNIYQSSIISSLGNLYLVISSKSTAADLFKEYISDEGSRRITRIMRDLFDSEDAAQMEDDADE